MLIKQFEDKHLSHYSYAILSDCESKIVLIDPARKAGPYYDFAKQHQAQIIGVIETHPHADFVSSHLEIEGTTGAGIYTSKLVEPLYPFIAFDEGDQIEMGAIRLSALNTPGHSPDSISVLLEHNGKQKAVFTGDTLFIGDCGRPDLREGIGKIQTTKVELAKQMYHSLRDKLMVLEEDVLVYPAHGAGTLCGKNLSKESSSTIGQEEKSNWSLQKMSEEEFVQKLLADQPFVPQYFPFDVELNRKGASNLKESLSMIKVNAAVDEPTLATLDKSLWMIDTRDESDFKSGHLPHAINIMENGKFETWLGSIIKPGELFYLVGHSKEQMQTMLERTAAIGYDGQVAQGLVINSGLVKEKELDVAAFKTNSNGYTIIDVRNKTEVKEGKIFENSISIPLAELRDRVNEIPTNKPIVVHCAGGYRSAAASSLIHAQLNGSVDVFDLGESVKQFQ